MREFVARFGVSEETRILDVGGTPANWLLTDVRPRVTLLNMPRGQERDEASFTFVSGDGCQLPFRDQSFEIVFSNSVIEHVGTPDQQRRFAHEIQRVGRRYWVQTPNRRFPVEPHLLTPLRPLATTESAARVGNQLDGVGLGGAPESRPPRVLHSAFSRRHPIAHGVRTVGTISGCRNSPRAELRLDEVTDCGQDFARLTESRRLRSLHAS